MKVPPVVQVVISDALDSHIEKMIRAYRSEKFHLKSRNDLSVTYIKEMLDWYLENCDETLHGRLFRKFEKLQDLVKKC